MITTEQFTAALDAVTNAQARVTEHEAGKDKFIADLTDTMIADLTAPDYETLQCSSMPYLVTLYDQHKDRLAGFKKISHTMTLMVLKPSMTQAQFKAKTKAHAELHHAAAADKLQKVLDNAKVSLADVRNQLQAEVDADAVAEQAKVDRAAVLAARKLEIEQMMERT